MDSGLRALPRGPSILPRSSKNAGLLRLMVEVRGIEPLSKAHSKSADTSSFANPVNTRYCWIEELTPMSVLPLAKTTSQNDAFEMFVDLALVLANSKGASILGGISV